AARVSAIDPRRQNARPGGGAAGSSAARRLIYEHQVARGDYDVPSRPPAGFLTAEAITPVVALSKEQIEDLYSRVPVLRPPPSVFVLRNAEIGAEHLYSAVHRLNTVAREEHERLRILGMHEMGTRFVLIAGDAGLETGLHEAVHYNGIRNEAATRVITRALMARANMNLGFRRRPVTYTPAAVDAAERDSFLASMHLSNPTAGQVDLIHLVYSPGG
ncbi:MAG: hypothetical protein ACREB9_08730, partial [Thermoplasmata archaeon]